MNINQINYIYFSPTGTTKRVLKLLSQEFNLPVTEYDFTSYHNSSVQLSFSETDFVIFGFPVYSGRVPETLTQKLKSIKGDSTPMAIVATYGNREFDDALLEMKQMMELSGFKTIGAMAAVTEHSVVRSIGMGRPNKEDKQILSHFGRELTKKLASITDITKEKDVAVSGNIPYRKYLHIPMTPKCTSKCNSCKVCIKICPAGAITYHSTISTDKKNCIGCMCCVRFCPQKARTLGILKTLCANIYMHLLCTKDKKSEEFL